MCQGGGAATQSPAERYHSGSNPDLGLYNNDLNLSMAAIAAGKLLFPSRTQKISLPAFRTVLRCASPRELRIAAMLT